MASNRLFIYDPISDMAVCIAKGYSNGWANHGTNDHVNAFYEAIEPEFTGDITYSRLMLLTEVNLPLVSKIFWEE